MTYNHWVYFTLLWTVHIVTYPWGHLNENTGTLTSHSNVLVIDGLSAISELQSCRWYVASWEVDRSGTNQESQGFPAGGHIKASVQLGQS